MNAAKITLTATMLAAALGLALGLAAAPAMADKPNCPGHDHGCGTDSEDATIFDVSLEFLRVVFEETVLEEVGPCTGDTDILANPGLTVNFDPFDPECSVDMTTDRVAPDDEVTMHLFRLEVKTKGSGVTEIVLNFTTLPGSVAGANLWVTDKLTAVVGPGPGDGELVLTPPDRFLGAGEILTKGHQPDKGAETIEGGLLIGIFTYTPRP